jgi:hypothetical protein
MSKPLLNIVIPCTDGDKRLEPTLSEYGSEYLVCSLVKGQDAGCMKKGDKSTTRAGKDRCP